MNTRFETLNPSATPPTSIGSIFHHWTFRTIASACLGVGAIFISGCASSGGGAPTAAKVTKAGVELKCVYAIGGNDAPADWELAFPGVLLPTTDTARVLALQQQVGKRDPAAALELSNWVLRDGKRTSADKMSNPLYLALHYLAYANDVPEPKVAAASRKEIALRFLTLLVQAPREYQQLYSGSALSAGFTLEAAGWYRSASPAQTRLLGKNAWDTQVKLGQEDLSKLTPDQLVQSAKHKMDGYNVSNVIEEKAQREKTVYGDRQAQRESVSNALNQLGAAAQQITAASNQQIARQQSQLQQMAQPRAAQSSGDLNRGRYYGGAGDITNSAGNYKNLSMHDTYVESAKAYRAAAAKLPADQAARRQEYLQNAAQMDAQARLLEGR